MQAQYQFAAPQHYFYLSILLQGRQQGVAAMISRRFSRFSMNCAHCNNELTVPEWTEDRNERQIHHLWRCSRCDFLFETIVSTKGDARNRSK
jgi:hypothetical protein